MSLTGIAAVALCLALFPALLSARNLRLYRVPVRPRPGHHRPAVSVLIPARDEERSIGAAVAAVLASRGVELEVVVADDQSTDATASIVGSLAERDPRVRLITTPPLPSGWCGKQHACATLARAARHDVLLFLDADVRLSGDGLERAVAFLEESGAALVSGVPQQVTGTLAEKLVVPLIHFLLLGFLPISRMRRSMAPAYAAGCGQLMLVRRDAYEAAGGHGAIRGSRHDGIMLPRALRRAGFVTDLFDATPVAICRMYESAPQVWNGFAKNADEGMASPAGILPWTGLLLGGQVLPLALLLTAPAGGRAAAFAALALTLSLATRLAHARRFRQPLTGALLHPLGILLVVAIQWFAFARLLTGRPLSWKGRVTA